MASISDRKAMAASRPQQENVLIIGGGEISRYIRAIAGSGKTVAVIQDGGETPGDPVDGVIAVPVSYADVTPQILSIYNIAPASFQLILFHRFTPNLCGSNAAATLKRWKPYLTSTGRIVVAFEPKPANGAPDQFLARIHQYASGAMTADMCLDEVNGFPFVPTKEPLVWDLSAQVESIRRLESTVHLLERSGQTTMGIIARQLQDTAAVWRSYLCLQRQEPGRTVSSLSRWRATESPIARYLLGQECLFGTFRCEQRPQHIQDLSETARQHMQDVEGSESKRDDCEVDSFL